MQSRHENKNEAQSNFKSKRNTWLVLGLLAFIALLSGLFVSQYMSKKNADLSKFYGTLLNEPRPVDAFSLIGNDDKPFNNNSLQKEWTNVFFGFTHCGYVCPTTLAELAKMYRMLQEQNIKPLPRVVFVTIDPERDTLTRLRHYISGFHPDFYAARGEELQVDKFAEEMGVAYEKIAVAAGKDVKEYDMQHTGALMLFNPQGQLRAFFTTPHQAEWLAKDYRMLIQAN